ncbi:porin [Flavihumibacter sp.]|uniref:porin n=1 Tax=Flavihumibacter sp. TaxID=1913981 RepID=UPI002FCB790E
MKRSLRLLICGFIAMGCFSLCSKSYAQEEITIDSAEAVKKFQWKAFIDAYYSYDFTAPVNHEKASFIYNHKRHNEFSINLAMLGGAYDDGSVRANLSMMAGNYPQYNLDAEPQLFRSIFEANIGVRISRKKALWLDAGIMPSHIGFETAINPDNWTLSRSILAENSPYYEAGLRLSYNSVNGKWYMAALLLNGWQRVRRVDGNNTPAFGSQITFSPAGKISFNWSTFIGNDKPDSARLWRYFNNIFAKWMLTENIGIILGLDHGLEQKTKNSSKLNSWYSPMIIVHYKLSKWSIAGRAEIYKDKNGVIVSLINEEPFEMQSYSLNVDRQIGKNLLWRTEGRIFKNSSAYFVKENSLVRSNQHITSSLSIRF